MTTTFASSGACLLKAGANVNSVFTGQNAETNWTSFINQAEQYICTLTKIDYLTLFSSLSANKKKLLEEVTTNIAASYAISYDLSGYTTRIGETMLDVLAEGTRRGIDLLKDKNFTADYISKP